MTDFVTPHKTERKKNRKKGYDYALSGFYFITICIKSDSNFIADIVKDKVIINDYGEIIKKQWCCLSETYSDNFVSHEFVIMPNHFHALVEIKQNSDKKLSEFIRGFKSISSRKINKYPDVFFRWQRSFYDRIIMDNSARKLVITYIKNNPKNWKDDDYFIEPK